MAATAARLLGDRQAEEPVLNTIGRVRAVELRQTCAEPFDEACAWSALGQAHLATGDRGQVRSGLQQAAARFRVAGQDSSAAAIDTQFAQMA